MNEHDLGLIENFTLVLTLIVMVNIAFMLLVFGIVPLFSVPFAVAICTPGIIGLLLAFSIGHIRTLYSREITRLLAEAVLEASSMLSEPIVSQHSNACLAGVRIQPVPEPPRILPGPAPSTGRPPRWSVVQYRGYDDFLYGSFDAYVTDNEIVIRGRLKRGQPSLYMRVSAPRWK